MTAFYHTPVLITEVLSLLTIEQGAWYIDGTLGGGGYSLAILRNGGKVVGIDTDLDAIEYARKRFVQEIPEKKEGIDWIVINDNFRNVKVIVDTLKRIDVRGMVLDIGVSSYQLDTKERGFSYRFEDSPLDMRMNRHEGNPASFIVNTYSREELYDIFARYGEEERAWAITDSIVLARRIRKLQFTKDIVQVVESLGGDKERTLARVFQALRIEVNDELRSLKDGLEGAEHVLPVGGKLIVVSFHSLEDRYVKQFLRRPCWKKITDVIVPNENELRLNVRSRSAKLRAGEKI